MDVVNHNTSFDGTRASPVQVLCLLVLTAFALSYLAAYAFTDSLLQADILQQWTPGSDPRPRLLAMCFVTLLSIFGTLGVLFRLVSSRELRSIDALANETEEFRITDV